MAITTRNSNGKVEQCEIFNNEARCFNLHIRSNARLGRSKLVITVFIMTLETEHHNQALLQEANSSKLMKAMIDHITEYAATTRRPYSVAFFCVV